MLAGVSASLRLGGATNLLDDHVAAEDVFAGLLNLIFGWELENLNIVRSDRAIYC